MTGALLAVALVLNPRVGGFIFILGPWGSFKRTLLRDQQFLLLSQPALVFTARSYEALFSQHWNPGMHGLAWGLEWLIPQVTLPVFIHHR